MTTGVTEAFGEIAIIGAGWAGLSAANRLVDAGHRVTVFEMAPGPGGRARQASVMLAGRRVCLDNGQHLLIGGYQQTLALIRAASNDCGTDARTPNALLRVPFQFSSTLASIRRTGPAQPGLLAGLLTARGFSLQARLAITAFGMRLALTGWKTPTGETVAQLLGRLGQPDQAVSRLWEPMCIAALNTPIETACAQVFVNVLRDSMIATPDSSDFLIPTTDLGSLFPDPIVARIRHRGAVVHFSSAVKSLSPAAGSEGNWEIRTRSKMHRFRHVILATPIQATTRVLDPVAPAVSAQLARFRFESIQTVYLAWPVDQAPALEPIRRLDDDPLAEQPGQWLISRQPQQGLALASVVISAPSDTTRQENDIVARQVSEQLVAQLNLPAPADALTINEKRATFSCTPGRPRASAQEVDGHPLPNGLSLAGDYCWPRYPATLEAAVLSGAQAAEHYLSTRQNP